uniref:Serpin domain-containing protein n=1 Tax=Setaria digitata TaxID=48799 RepID=A0A915PKW1_9BILA
MFFREQNYGQFSGHSPCEYAQVDVGVRLLQELAQNGKSVVISPLSVSAALFALYLATNDKTKTQLKKFLGRIIDKQENDYTLSLANRLYVRQDSSVKDGYDRLFQFHFGGEKIRSFSCTEKEQLEVNEWISNRTNNKITHVISSKKIYSLTKMLLVSTIDFKGVWEKQFQKNITQNAPFYISRNETKNMSMMQITDDFPYYEDDFAQVIKLPYIGHKLEMIIILPKIRFGYSDVLRNITAVNLLNYVINAVPTRITLRLPMFQVKGKMNLKKSLKKIGIARIFAEKADFGQLTDDPIYISNVTHAAFIQVDEKGTQSTPAKITELEHSIKKADMLFSVDHPFLFAVVKDATTVLFAGQYVT